MSGRKKGATKGNNKPSVGEKDKSASGGSSSEQQQPTFSASFPQPFLQTPSENSQPSPRKIVKARKSTDKTSNTSPTRERINDSAAGGSSSTDKLTIAKSEKLKGDEAFRKEEYDSARKSYTKAFSLVDKEKDQQLLLSLLNNRAITNLRLNTFPSVEHDCTTALEIDSKNVKSFCIRAFGRLYRNDFKGAYEDLDKALPLAGPNSSEGKTISRVRELFKQFEKNSM